MLQQIYVFFEFFHKPVLRTGLILFLGLFFLLCSCASMKGNKASVPEIEQLVAASSNEIRLTLAWSNADAPLDYDYGLYRGKIPLGDSIAQKNNDYDLVKRINPVAGSNTTQEIDSRVKPGYTYFYQIFTRKKTKNAHDDGNLPLEIRNDHLASDIMPELQNTKPRYIELPHPTPAGIYVGIISFSSDVIDITKTTNEAGEEIGALVPIDSFSRTDALLQQFTTNYKLSPNNGTALYYAFHKAIVNIVDNLNAKKVPADITSIHIITLTDGKDNASANPALKNLEASRPEYRIAKSERLNNHYPQFLERIVRSLPNANIEGIPLKAWLVNLSPDLGDEELKSISNTQDEHHIVKIEDVKNFFGAVAKELDTIERRTTLTVTLPSFFNGAEVAIRIKANGITEFIRGAIRFTRDRPCFVVDRTLSTPNLYIDADSDNSPLFESSQTGDNDYAYKFILNKNLLPDTDVSVLLNKDGAWREDTEFIKDFNYNPFVERKSALVYFVLDSSKSLSGDIDIIRDAARETIEELYRKNIGEEKKTEIVTREIHTGREPKVLTQEGTILDETELARLLENNMPEFWRHVGKGAETESGESWFRIEISGNGRTQTGRDILTWKVISENPVHSDVYSGDIPVKSGEIPVWQTALDTQALSSFIAETGGKFWLPPTQSSNLPLAAIGSGLGFWVQLGAYDTLQYALHTLQILYTGGVHNVFIFNEAGLGKYKVRMGPYDTKFEAQSDLEKIRARGP
jgi:hypothetical protein